MAETLDRPAVAKSVEKFSHRRISVGPQPTTAASPPVVIPAPQQKLVLKLSEAQAQKPQQKLRNDGPTLEEYVAAGYDPESYPPEGYAVREVVYRFAKLRGTAAKTVFPDKSFHQWYPKRQNGGGYAPTTSFETTDAKLAAKLREAAKTDSSIREAPTR